MNDNLDGVGLSGFEAVVVGLDGLSIQDERSPTAQASEGLKELIGVVVEVELDGFRGRIQGLDADLDRWGLPS